MNLYDAHNAKLSIGDRIFFTGSISRIDTENGAHILWVRPDQQPDGFCVEQQCHPRTVERLPDES